MSYEDTVSLWTRLREAGLVDGEKPGASDVVTPWYVRAMMGIAGWIGASFLLSFVAAGLTVIMESVPALLVVGTLVCVGAASIYKKGPDNDFLCQFAFAVSLSGQGLFLYGLMEGLSSQYNTVAVLMMAAETLLFFNVDNFLHRVWSAMVAVVSFLYLIGRLGFAPYALAILTALFSLAWLNEFSHWRYRRQIQALGYALTIMLVACALMGGNAWTDVGFSPAHGTDPLLGEEISHLIGPVMVGGVFICVVVKLLAGEGVPPGRGAGLLAMAGATALALATVKAQGIGAVLVILLIGFSHGNRVLCGTGAMGILAYLSQYYYFLEITLLQKSALLCCTGVALLAARRVLKYRWSGYEDREGKRA